jgi:phosphoribosylformylglycinamidine cyclo-ligase
VNEQPPQRPTLSYRDAGVDIDAGNRLVDRIKPHARRTMRPGVLGGLGGFGALFELPLDRYRQPVLVSGTDGVGTKLKLALELESGTTPSASIWWRCALTTCWWSAPNLVSFWIITPPANWMSRWRRRHQGHRRWLRAGGRSAGGRETAEMPGMYQAGDYDLAGFCVGVVEKAKIIDPRRVQVGDVLLGLASSGPHSNGYSLIRKILAVSGADLDQPFADRTLGEALLAPTRIYVKPICKLLTGRGSRYRPHHRRRPDRKSAARATSRYQGRHRYRQLARPAVFQWLQQQGGVAEAEMWRTFNCGVGLVVCVAADAVDRTTGAIARMRAKPLGSWAISPRIKVRAGCGVRTVSGDSENPASGVDFRAGSNLQAILDQAASGDCRRRSLPSSATGPAFKGWNAHGKPAFRRWSWITNYFPTGRF